MALTVKAFFEKPGYADAEIRRFAVDADVASCYEYISKKIAAVFPDVGNTPLALYWKDSEGDLIAFSSDDELTEALGNIERVFKVYVKVRDAHHHSPNEGVLHPGVVCDACDNGIRGNRYKCTVCDDFDLCSGCMAKEMHPEHDMICMRTPRPGWMGFMGHPGGPMRFGRRGRGGRGGPFGPGGPFGRGGHCHRKHGGPAWMNVDLDDKEDGDEEKAEESGDQKKGKMPPPFPIWMRRQVRRWKRMMAAYQQEDVANATAATDSPQKEEERPGDEVPHPENKAAFENYLVSVGQQVARMLDPLGIDVDIDIEHNNVRKKAAGGKKGKGKDEPGHTVNEANKDVEMEDSENSQKQPQNTETQPKDLESSPDRNSDGDWTLMDDATELSKKTASTENASTQLYPELADVHPDPKIAAALQQMLGMGFNNDDNWLLRLLEAKGGDISKVFEAMHPSIPK